MNNFYTLLEINSQKFSSKTAVICQDNRISYADLVKRINQTAFSLKKIGVCHGSIVGIMLPNSAAFVEVFYAVQRLGAVAALFNVKNTSSEIEHAIHAINCEYFIYCESYEDRIAAIRGDITCIKTWICDGKGTSSFQNEYLEQLILNGDPEWNFVQSVSENDDALMVFTSGTTGGVSKAAIYNQQSFLMWLFVSEFSTSRYESHDIMLNYAPMSHFGGLGRLLRTLSKGGTIILMPKFSVDDLFSLIAKERPTGMFLVPPTLCYKLKVVNASLGVDLSCVKRVETGATIIPPDSIKCLFDLFSNAKIIMGYGASECNPTTLLELTKEDFIANSHLINSIGRAAYGCQIKLVDDNGNEVKCGQTGEAWIKSLSQMRGYSTGVNHLIDGWWPSGDLLRQDADGYYYFMDRKKDMIKSGGEIVTSFEVEKQISSHPAIEVCSVVGIPSKTFGERVVAAVIKRKGAVISEEELIQYCKSNLAKYKVPKRIFFVQEIPTTSTGKISKVLLKNQIMAYLEAENKL